jgi:DNA-binding NarL/FixJ family response regulator
VLAANDRRRNDDMRRSRVLLADDHQMLLDALKELLAPDYEVVGLVSNGRSLLKVAVELLPDVIVIDIAMPQLNGLDAGRQLKRLMPSVKLIFMTMHEDPYLVREAFRAGASAFLHKQAAGVELNEAIETVLKGRSYVTPSAAKGLDNISLREPKHREHAPEPTARQREVIQLLAEGRTMNEAAGLLYITPRTVAAHKYTVMEMLQLKTTADLVQYAIKHRIIAA